LAGWDFSNDVEKRDRWHKTLAWADRYGQVALLGDIAEKSMYVVGELDDSVEPPVILKWNYESRSRATADERAQAKNILLSS
jgi:hypothetical protein